MGEAEREDRKEEVMKNDEDWEKSGGAKRQAEWKTRQAKKLQDADDARSDVSVSTASSVTSHLRTNKKATAKATPRLSALEEREARKCEKVLREIDKIEDRMQRGEEVEQNQIEKVRRRADVENTLVMQKVRVGY